MGVGFLNMILISELWYLLNDPQTTQSDAVFIILTYPGDVAEA